MLLNLTIFALLTQFHQQHDSAILNFTAIDKIWNFESLYILYNNDTIAKQELYEYIEKFFDFGKGCHSCKPFIVADMKSHHMGGFSFNPLMIIMAAHIYDPVLLKANQITRGKKNICILIFIKENEEEKNLKFLFEFLFRKQFRRVLVVTEGNKLYRMKAYPTVSVMNVSQECVKEYFPPPLQWNLEGYVIKVPVQIDVPNTFWYYDKTLERIRLDGIGGIVFETFMKVMNVSMDIYPLFVNDSNYLNMDYIEEMLMNESIEISPHLYTTLRLKPIDYSYSYITTSRCMMLPINDMKQFKVSHVVPYHWTIWSLIFIFIIVSELVCQLALRYHPDFKDNRLYHHYFPPGTVAFYMISILISAPLPNQKLLEIRKKSLIQYLRTLFCYTIIAFGGFCFSEMYSSTLTSRLTVSIPVEPKTSVEKILNMKEPIMATNQARRLFLNDPRFGARSLSKIIFTSPQEFHNNRMHMNTSYIYPTSEDRWSVLTEQQKFLTQKRFWLSNICVGNFPLRYQMRLDSPFEPYFRKFVMHVRETGLHSYWKSNVFRWAIKSGFLRYFKDHKSVKFYDKRQAFAFSLSTLTFWVYICGIVLSCATFDFV
ncbi:LOW QUALITY PROTEIN: uncharacterized protein ACRADG_012817 [Cochliomyia hominivorax]